LKFVFDIFRICDACGQEIGFTHKYCPKCQIYLCNLCSLKLMLDIQKKFPTMCPMCGRELMYPE
jgi:hypothetical protein